jgi:RND superfamily putative drug exporter
VVYKSQDRVLAEKNVAVIYDLVEQLNNHPSVIRTESILSITPNLSLGEYQELFSGGLYSADLEMSRAVKQISSEDATFIKVVPSEEIMHDDTKELVESIRSMPVGGDLKMYVTGSTADLMDSIDVIYGSFPVAIIYVLVTIYIALFSLFRSIVLPLKAVIMNGLSIFATYGALVFIFQEGNLQGVLGFESMGYTDAIMPIVLFCITFGISMDYEVFLLSRVKELYDENGNNTASVALGLEKTGRIITSAALVMILVCGSFALADIVIVKMFGVGLGLAILIDATLVRALMVPAIMRVMGDLNWWCPNLNPRQLWTKSS